MTTEGAGQDPSHHDGKCQLLLVEEVFGSLHRKMVHFVDKYFICFVIFIAFYYIKISFLQGVELIKEDIPSIMVPVHPKQVLDCLQIVIVCGTPLTNIFLVHAGS